MILQKQTMKFLPEQNIKYLPVKMSSKSANAFSKGARTSLKTVGHHYNFG